jgi:putative ABC transport system permease protein
MTEAGLVDIGYLELAAASLLMVIAGLVSYVLELGQLKNILISLVRCFIQLLAAGFILRLLFDWQTWWLVLLLLLFMLFAATQIATSRIKNKIPGLYMGVFLSLSISSLAVGFLVVEAIIHADPWYNARQLIPIAGMVIGNAMSAIAVATDRLFYDLDARADEMFSLIALGATRREAAFASLKSAIGAGMLPILATMSAAGVVTIPGMMSGQILAGADPFMAAKYQIVVILMLSAANTMAIVMACFYSYRKRFSSTGYYLDKGIRP